MSYGRTVLRCRNSILGTPRSGITAIVYGLAPITVFTPLNTIQLGVVDTKTVRVCTWWPAFSDKNVYFELFHPLFTPSRFSGLNFVC